MPVTEEEVEAFMAGCMRITHDHMDRNFPTLTKPVFRLEELQKRYRIVNGGGVHAFVDKETGDVLKPATWSKPAKHARGNLRDEHNGLGRMGPYGPAYLR
jgi:hypothetical protein